MLQDSQNYFLRKRLANTSLEKNIKRQSTYHQIPLTGQANKNIDLTINYYPWGVRGLANRLPRGQLFAMINQLLRNNKANLNVAIVFVHSARGTIYGVASPGWANIGNYLV